MITQQSETVRTEPFGPYTLCEGWPKPDDALRHDVVAFWAANGALPPRESDSGWERSAQVVVAARETNSGAVVGVSTAVRRHVGQLGFPCFYYRTFVDPQHRNLWMVSKRIFNHSYSLLDARFQAGHDSDVVGIYMELQNDGLNQVAYAVWELDGPSVVYIGRNAEGLHRRVCYFRRAKLPLPSLTLDPPKGG